MALRIHGLCQLEGEGVWEGFHVNFNALAFWECIYYNRLLEESMKETQAYGLV